LQGFAGFYSSPACYQAVFGVYDDGMEKAELGYAFSQSPDVSHVLPVPLSNVDRTYVSLQRHAHFLGRTAGY
jgi:hypothetical protein